MRCLLFVLLILSPTPAQILQPRLVTDINRQPRPNGSSHPATFAAGGGAVWFAADDGIAGRELFVTQGTTSSTRLALDLEPGAAGSNPEPLGMVGGRLLFLFRRGNDWHFASTDGTPSGTRTLQLAAPPGSPSVTVRDIAVIGGRACIPAWDANGGVEPWITDGLQAVRIADLMPGSVDSRPEQITAAGNRWFFVAAAPHAGRELFVTDGTLAGTALVRDMDPGPISSLPSQLLALGTKLVFAANSPTFGQELFMTDGTSAGTVLLADVAPGVSSSQPVLLGFAGTMLCFAANDRQSGSELWITDGTTPGTRLLADLNPGAASSAPWPVGIAGGVVYFMADDGLHGSELWRTDGTASGTRLVADLNSPQLPTWITAATALGSRLVFLVRTGTIGVEPWVTDGTPAGTTLLRDIHPSGNGCPSAELMLDPTGTRVLFQADDGVIGTELWATDGSSAGTQLVADLHAPGPGRTDHGIGFAGSDGLFDWYGELYFAANDGVRGLELWTSDGSATGTRLVADLRTGPGHALPQSFASLPDRLLFVADEGPAPGRGRELFATDGTAAGTLLLHDICRRGTGNSDPSRPVVVGRRAVFAADDRGTTGVGRELWMTDGTVTGTQLLKDIRPGSIGSDPDHFVRMRNRVYFSADDGVHGRELWVTDGTPAGTGMAVDLRKGPVGSAPSHIVEHQGLLYFAGDDGVLGSELWRSDGTSIGTLLVADLVPGAWSSHPSNLESAGGRLWFNAIEPSGIGIWTSDGTRAGTRKLVAPTQFGESLFAHGFAALGTHVVFTVADHSYPTGSGEELWISDGTSAGTRLFYDFMPGIRVGGNPGGYLRTGSRFVLFTAKTFEHGRELWLVDRSLAPPLRLTDLNPGAASSGFGAVVARGKLFLIGDDGRVGSELWVVEDIGAHAKPVGHGYSAPFREPRLDLDDPVLGAVATVTLSGTDSLAPGILIVGAVRRPIPLGAGSELYVDPNGLLVIATFTTDANGRAALTLPVPGSLAPLRGVPFAMQACIAPTRNPLGFDTSQAIHFALGH